MNFLTMVQYLCFHSRQLTGNVMKLPEDQLHMIPYIQGAEPWVGLSKGHKLILIELIGFHRHRVERESFINSKIYGKIRQNCTHLTKKWCQDTIKTFKKRWGKTCGDAVEVPWCEVVDSASLELKGTRTVDRRNRRVGLLHPVYQPLDFTVATERVPTQVSGQQIRKKENMFISQTYIFQT